jgi:hypothetical protein
MLLGRAIMAMKHVRSDEDLVKIQQHLDYEVEMLSSTAIMLRDYPRVNSENPEQQCAHYGLLEAFLIHARVLIDFLYRHSSRCDEDVFAHHFVQNPDQWISGHPKPPADLEEVKKQVGKRVAHLSYARARPGFSEWRFVEIAERVLSDLNEWTKQAPEGKLSGSLRNTIHRALREISKKQGIRTVDSTTRPEEVRVYNSGDTTTRTQ